MIKPFNETQDIGFLKFERDFLSAVSLVALIISLSGFTINFLIGLDFSLLCITSFSILFFSFLYYFSRKDFFVIKLKWIASLGSLIILNLLWFYNYGYRGPAPYFFVIVYSILVYIWHGKKLNFFTVIIIVNLIIIFVFDFFYPEVTQDYKNEHSRVLDIYTGIVFYIAIIFLVISKAKNSYLREYLFAKEAEHLKSAFLANMSHEIRTPLNAIIGFSNLIAESDVNHQKRIEYKDLIEENSNQLLQLINDILDISKLEANQLTITFKTIEFNDFIKKTHKNISYLLEKMNNENIQFNLENHAGNFRFEIDETRLNQILNNIISNAVKFTDAGSITLTTRLVEHQLLIEIKDTGIGMNEQHLNKIFDRFYRIDNMGVVNSKRELYRGTGLGLYLSQGLTQQLGGKLWATSLEGKGSTFFLKLPLRNYEALEQKEIPKNIIEPKPKKTTISELKVMVVEDDYFNQVFFKELFKRFKINIVVAGTGEEAIKIIENNSDFDLMFLDIKLPGISGMEVLKTVRKMGIKAKIIAQTANAMEGDEKICIDAGFDHYIPKPIKKAVVQEILIDFISKNKKNKIEDIS